MIARIWRGCVPCAKADRYFELMRDIAAPDYQSCVGNFGVWCLRREQGDLTEVTMVTHWRDLDAIREFAGESVTTAKYYEFDRDFLLDFPETVEHHEIAAAFGTR